MLENFGHGASTYRNTPNAEHYKSQAFPVQGHTHVLFMLVSAGQ
jgi:hypothetical protein